jgi:hypothetical protein
VCREHENESRYSDFKSDPVPICSLPCPDALVCLVCEAARATSAAPTYFPVQKISGRSFVDGGMEFNNPSYAIFDHYSQIVRVAESRRTSVATEAGLHVPDHGNLDFSRVRIVNLGTGTKASGLNGHGPSIFSNLIIPPIRMFSFLQKALKDMVVNSENTAKQMMTLARVSRDTGSCNFKFERFSANNGVCHIKMYRFEELGTITHLTQQYLENPDIQRGLQRVAEEIACEYIDSHRPGRPATLTVPDRRPSRPQVSTTQQTQATCTQQPQAPTSQFSESFPLHNTTQSGMSLSRDNSDASNSATTEASLEPASTVYIPTPIIPPRQSADITGPADCMVKPLETVAPVRS